MPKKHLVGCFQYFRPFGCSQFDRKGKGKVHPCTGTETLYTRKGLGFSVTLRPLFIPGKD